MFTAVAEYGERHGFEAGHAHQVARLALQLFDQLQPLHGMGNTERIWLCTAAILHDIGKRWDARRHHKLARDLILAGSSLPFRRGERTIIALVARYHRGPLPHDHHKHFRDLDGEARLYVKKLAALLRVADGLDKGHVQLVESVQCAARPGGVLIQVLSRDVLNINAILRKVDLLEQVFRRRITVRVSIRRPRLDSFLDADPSLVYADAD